MKKFLLTLFVVSVISFSSCGWVGTQRYTCDVEEVESAQIVRLDRYIEEENMFEYTILAQIEEYEEFISCLNGLKHRVNWGEPSIMHDQYIVIKVDYKDGNFDLIHSRAQLFYRLGNYQTGFFFFDEEQFNSLISDYITN
jgi:hypothetical protein